MNKRVRLPIRQLGFTVVETLIVLAVTSSLFVISATLISGKQNKTDFQIGSRAMQQQLQQIINETASGYYPNNGFTCNVTPTTVSIVTGGSPTLGQNSNCIFGGKVVVFSSAARDSYAVYSLAGRRIAIASGGDVKNAKEAQLTAISNSVNTVKIPNSLQFVSGDVQDVHPASSSWDTSKFVVAFLPTFAQSDAGSGLAGSQQIEVHRLNTWTDANVIASINNEASASNPNIYPFATNGVLLCLQSGGTDQSALYTITPGLDVQVQIRSGTSCS